MGVGKKVIGLRLVESRHTGEYIDEKVACVIREFGLLDKIMAITLDNASSNTKAMETLNPMFAGYLGFEPAPTDKDPNARNIILYINVVHAILLIS